ncbi:MAG: SDR family NAD(P)-dependent oxidoreductase [Ruthenibacterium lactatiformans]
MKELYLVTGATGHLGNTVAHRLARAGRQVRALVLPGEEHAPQLPGGVEAVAGDVRSPASLEALFAGAEGRDVTVIHCAGIVSIASRFDQNVYDVNVTGTKNVVDACVRRGVKKLVHVSSVHALPEKPAARWCRDGRVQPRAVVGLYAKTRPRPRVYALATRARGWTSASCIPRASAARMTTAMDT